MRVRFFGIVPIELNHETEDFTLADVGPSCRGTYVKTIKPKPADNDELGQTIISDQILSSGAML